MLKYAPKDKQNKEVPWEIQNKKDNKTIKTLKRIKGIIILITTILGAIYYVSFVMT